MAYTAEFSNSFSNTTDWTASGPESDTPIDADWERVTVTDGNTSTPRSARLRIVQQ